MQDKSILVNENSPCVIMCIFYIKFVCLFAATQQILKSTEIG